MGIAGAVLYSLALIVALELAPVLTRAKRALRAHLHLPFRQSPYGAHPTRRRQAQ
jgi:hypothetical protein